MDLATVAGVIGLGFAAGVTSGMLGVGGGVIFVPALVFFLDQGQLDAESTSLLAIVPVAILGAWRQHGYGNLRLREGLIVGMLAPPGILLGTTIANEVSERTLELSFAALQLFFAISMARRALAPRDG
ncbi:MAG TPA: sulfite exporter TauE/SafE family protein [Thermoleophilaceae bacterium]